jgi:hypothetical protein
MIRKKVITRMVWILELPGKKFPQIGSAQSAVPQKRISGKLISPNFSSAKAIADEKCGLLTYS